MAIENPTSFRREDVKKRGGGITCRQVLRQGTDFVIRELYQNQPVNAQEGRVIFGSGKNLTVIAKVYKDNREPVFVHVRAEGQGNQDLVTVLYGRETGKATGLITGHCDVFNNSPVALFDLEQETVYLFASDNEFEQKNVSSRLKMQERQKYVCGDCFFTFSVIDDIREPEDTNFGFGVHLQQGGWGVVCPLSIGSRIKNRLISNSPNQLARMDWPGRFEAYTTAN